MKIPVGATIVSTFAVIWTAAGARNLDRRWFFSLLLMSILISLGVIYVTGQMQPAHPFKFNAKAYNISVAFEVILIFIAVLFLRRAERKALLLPVISIIVGLHFIGMVWALGSNLYWWIAGAMSLLPVITMSILPRNMWGPVVGLGCAVILWLSAICAFF
jgi:hypothetical protein